MIRLRYVILFVLFLSTGSSIRSLDWCAYWRALHQDHLRPECNGIYRVRFSRIRAAPTHDTTATELRGDFLNGFHRYRAEVTGVNSLTKRVLGIGKRTLGFYKNIHSDECASTYSFCRTSTICESGAVCLSDSGYCCARNTIKPK